MGGKDCVAIDRILCEILKLDPHKIPTLRAAEEMNVGCQDSSKISIVGSSIQEVQVQDFIKAEPLPIRFEFSHGIRNIIKNLYERYIRGKTAYEAMAFQ
ncbi:MAG: hypothetical protein HYS07_01900 [Chlamydiae bacterium]|nr:hypothetical protein [Chlamydiota bacterium]MBI3277315.1 hypothetical protein [Chlamydiota bacterium]